MRALAADWSRLPAILLIGLIAGMMVEEYFLLKVVLSDLPGEEWAQVQANFGRLHPFTVIPMAVVGVALVILTQVREGHASSLRGRLTWTAAGIGLAIGLLTALVMMPLNHAITAWTQGGLPADWTETRDRWIFFQGVRAGLAIVGFFCLAGAGALPRPSTR